ncbi:MAG: hypothetical protein ABI091_12990 [Ferruginibacter sp.]
MIRIKKINKHVVSPIDVPKVEPERIKGFDLIPKLYCAIFICAKKESGKTNTIFKILKECTGKRTTLYIVSSTVFNDDNWRAIVKHFKKKKINMVIATSLEDANIDHKVAELQKQAEEEMDAEDDDSEPVPKLEKLMAAQVEEPKERKEKKVAPEYIFVFDDMSTELRKPSISTLIKKHRHFKTKVICSSQYVNDLAPDSRKNIDIWLLFGGHSINKLEEIYKNCDLKIPLDLFIKLYENATDKPYSFLYIDKNKGEFRRTFNMEYEIL